MLILLYSVALVLVTSVPHNAIFIICSQPIFGVPKCKYSPCDKSATLDSRCLSGHGAFSLNARIVVALQWPSAYWTVTHLPRHQLIAWWMLKVWRCCETRCTQNCFVSVKNIWAKLIRRFRLFSGWLLLSKSVESWNFHLSKIDALYHKCSSTRSISC